MFGEFFTSLGTKLNGADQEQQKAAAPPQDDPFQSLFNQLSSQSQKQESEDHDDPLDFLNIATNAKSVAQTTALVSNSQTTTNSSPSQFLQPTNAPEKQSTATQQNQWDNESEISSEGDKETIIIQIDESSPNRVQNPPQPARNEQAPIFETPENNNNTNNTAMPVDEPEQTTQQQPRKRDYLTSFMSLTGNTVKQVVAKAQSVQPVNIVTGSTSTGPAGAKMSENDQQTVVSVLQGENTQLKELVTEQQEKVEDLQDAIEVHKSLEEEAHEDNEELKYRVKYLEELARENGHDISSLKRIQELGSEKKSLQAQVTALERQMRLLEKLQFSKERQQQNSSAGMDEEDQQIFENPKRALNDLKTLFETNKIQFSRSDEARVLTALYTQEKPVVRLYREMLYRKIAQKAIQSADHLFQQTNTQDRNGNQMSKIMLQNKRLTAQNESLKKKISAAQEYAKKTQEERLHEKVRSKHKLSRVQGKARDLAEQVAGMRASMLALKTQVGRTQDSLEDDEMLNLNIQRFSSYLSYFLEEQNEKQSLVKQEFERQLSSSQQENTELTNRYRQQYDEISSQLSKMTGEKASMQEELGESHEMISHLEQEMNRCQEESLSAKSASQVMQSMLQQEIQALQQRPVALQQEIQVLQSEKASLSQREQAMQQEIQALQVERSSLQQREMAIQQENQVLLSEKSSLQQREQAMQLEKQALQLEIQTLQQRPQGSPISGGTNQQQVSNVDMGTGQAQEAPSQQAPPIESQNSEAQQQISELEKMLEEREEEIIELMDEVNKLQQQKQQSPEVINTLQILKSKLHHSQQRFQDYQHLPKSSNSQKESKLAQGSKQIEADLISPKNNAVAREEVKSAQQPKEQHIPILIEDQGRNEDKSSQGISPPAQPSPDKPRNQQSTETFTQDFFTKLGQEQQKDHQEQKNQNSSPETGEPFSRIVKEGIDSNFFSSLAYDSSAEKGQKPVEPEKQINDMFSFLMEPTKQVVKEAAKEQVAQFDNWSEAFGLPVAQPAKAEETAKKESIKVETQETAEPRFKQNQQNLEVNTDQGGWGEDDLEDDDEDNLDIEIKEEEKFEAQKIKLIKNGAHRSYVPPIQLSPRSFNKVPLGEIMRVHSVEDSPITQLKSQNSNETQNKHIKTAYTMSGEIDAKYFESESNKHQSVDMNAANNMLRENKKKNYHSPDIQRVQSADSSTPNNPIHDSMNSTNSRHKRQAEIQRVGAGGFLDGSLEQLGNEIAKQRRPPDSQDSQDESIPQNEQRYSYQAAIDSVHQSEQEQQSKNLDMDSEMYDQLMDEEQHDEEQHESEDSSLLHNSPFDNSFARQEVEIVVQTIRKNSLQDACSSPLLQEEKKVNISNLSDLVPEDLTCSEKLNDTDEDNIANGRLRPGDLNEVQEVDDEEISSDVHAASPRPNNDNDEQLGSINEQLKTESSEVLDMETSNLTRKASEDYNESKEMVKTVQHAYTPSLADLDQLGTEELSPDKIARGAPSRDLELMIPPSPESSYQQKVVSAKFDDRRKDGTGCELNPFLNLEAPDKHQLTQQDSESKESDQPHYETLAEFTKENFIKYQADGVTESANVGAHEDEEEDTADFEDSKGQHYENNDDCDEEEEQSDDDKPVAPTNVNGSAFFTRDYRVLAKANYGSKNHGDVILKQLQEEHGFLNSRDSLQSNQLEESHEQNYQSFAEPPAPEPELSACSIDPDQLLKEGNFMQQDISRGSFIQESFDNSQQIRGSFVDSDAILNSRLGSMIMPGSMVQPGSMILTGSIVEPAAVMRRGDENSIEFDGVPQVENYHEEEEVENSGEEQQHEQEVERQDSQGVDEQEDLKEEEIGDDLGSAEADEVPQYEDEPVQVEEINDVDDEDTKSLETVGIAKSTDVSPVKYPLQGSVSSEEPEEMGVMQSNQQNNEEESDDHGTAEQAQIAATSGNGWEDDESLEEIETPVEHRSLVEQQNSMQSEDPVGQSKQDEEEKQEDDQLNRSISANEQVSDAVQAPLIEQLLPQVADTEQQENKDDQAFANQDIFSSDKIGQALNPPKVENEPEESSPQNTGTKPEAQGWAEDSDDISIDDDEILPLEEPVQNNEKAEEKAMEFALEQSQPSQFGGTSPSKPSALVAQNEQLNDLFSPSPKASKPAEQPNFEDLFGLAAQKQEQVIADPFSMLMGGASASNNSMAPSALFQAAPKETAAPLFGAEMGLKKEEESGNVGGGGWGDDDDDIDIE